MPLLQAALNGDRDHPAVPRTPEELAAEARASVDAGARVLHLHPHDAEGRQTFDAEPCAAAIRAVRAVCPGIPISLSTSAEIEADPGAAPGAGRRVDRAARARHRQPGRGGILDLCALLVERGVGIEAGLLSLDDAHAFVASGIAGHCVRAMVEPLGEDPDMAVAEAEAIENVLAIAGIGLEQVHHGDGLASWAVNRRGAALGHGIRTGLEDTPVLPDGSPAAGNGELVAAAAAILAELASD